MQYKISALLSGILGSLMLAAAVADQTDDLPRFQDSLDVPALQIEGAAVPERQPMLALARAGDRLVSAGLRGVVLLSDDQGKNWRQAHVPVQSDLTAVHFPSALKGWAVGHEGVVLHSADGGETWQKQLDGREALQVLTPYYESLLAAGDELIGPHMEQLVFNTEAGAILPYLGVHFDGELTGYVVGAFGMAIKTEDGGKTWMPWSHRIDNKYFLNLNDIRAVGSDVFIPGEEGTVFRLDREQDRFVAVHTDYRGSFFGVAGDDDKVVVFGLRGHAFVSHDRGESWVELDIGIDDSFIAGAVADDGESLLLVSSGGRLALSEDWGQHFEVSRSPRSMLYSGVLATATNGFVLAGGGGLVADMPGAHDKREPNQAQELLR